METTKESLINEKELRLKEILAGHSSLAVAYSGGVDSTYLADVAAEVLGARACLIIADSPSIPREELSFAQELARTRGWRLEVIETHEFDDPAFLKNDRSRCYHCKTELFRAMRRHAEKKSIMAIAYGENAEDGNDLTRVGSIAAREQGACAPLAEAGFTKEDIRVLSRRRGLPTWDKPSFACLASRVPTGTALDPAVLARVEQAEKALQDMGCRQYRARHHGDLCRIEIDPVDMALLLDAERRCRLVAVLRALGYRHVTLDLAGYRTGSTAG